MEIIRLDGVTPEHMENAGKDLQRSGVTAFSCHAGSLAGDCFKADYRYDPASGVLVVTPSQLPQAVGPAYKRLVATLLTGRQSK